MPYYEQTSEVFSILNIHILSDSIICLCLELEHLYGFIFSTWIETSQHLYNITMAGYSIYKQHSKKWLRFVFICLESKGINYLHFVILQLKMWGRTVHWDWIGSRSCWNWASRNWEQIFPVCLRVPGIQYYGVHSFACY